MKTLILTILSTFLFLTISAKADELVLDTLWHQDYKNSIVGSYALSPDGRYFVVGLAGSSFKTGAPSIPAKIQTFDAVTGELIREFSYEVPQIPEDNGFLNYASIMFSETGDKLYVYYVSSNIAEFQTKQIVIHDFETGEPLKTLNSVIDAGNRVLFLILLDDNRILAWNEAGLINIIDVEQDKIVHQFQLTYLTWYAKVIYNKTNNLIATSGSAYFFDEYMQEEGYLRTAIHLYDGTTYEWRGRLYYNHYQWDIEDTIGTQVLIESLRFSNEGNYLVSTMAGEEVYIYIWDVNEKEIIVSLYSPNQWSIISTMLSSDRKYMLTSQNPGGFISLYNLNLKQIVNATPVLESYIFIDKSPDDKIIYIKGASALFAIKSPWNTVSVKDDSKPADIIIYPNPTSGNAEIKFDLKIPDFIETIVFDETGRKVNQFPHNFYSEGQHIYYLNTSNMKSGLYIVNLNGKHINLNFKLHIIK